MRAASLFTAGLLGLSNVVAIPSTAKVELSTTPNKRWNDTPGFVYSEGGKFKIDGKDFFFAGTTAYWLTQVQTNDDICKTLEEIAADDQEVVRIWGFREVVGETNDDPATFTQQWVDGCQKCNQAGIDRIKYILDQAEKLGIFVQIVLTNNWAPDFPADGQGNQQPGFLSNSYGGIDTYVKQTSPENCDHDVFYTDEAVKAAYKTWLSCIIPQLANHKALFAWELVNDLRCQGAEGTTTSGNCNTQTITNWIAELSGFVKSLDPNHMVASGDGGFFCPTCEKVNGGDSKYKLKRWNSDYPPAGPGFDGSQGIDTEDILRIPTVDFGGFQLFPDQFSYAAESKGYNDQNAFDCVLQEGLDWIDNHVDTAAAAGKPVHWSGFGLVEIDDAPFFVPFNSTKVADTFLDDTSNDDNADDWDDNFDGLEPLDDGSDDKALRIKRAQRVSSNRQQRRAYGSWAGRAVRKGAGGITNYQKGKSGLTGRDRSKRSIEVRQQKHRNAGSDSQGNSPNDGYRIAKEGIKNIFKRTGKSQKKKSGRDSD
ncbi:hypothetical protein FRC00_003249 [Tulasnella sp. 408]|nr:hypothetical protein FRC00_003249 [Tulasnella sp. 408]